MKNKPLVIPMLLALLMAFLIVAVHVDPVASSLISKADYESAVIKVAERLVTLQSPTDYGWDWVITGLTSHSPNPSAANIYGVTALELLDAYKLTSETEFYDAAKAVADYLMSLGSNRYHYQFDLEFLIEFAEISGDTSYKDFASAVWTWIKAKEPEFADGVTLYNWYYTARYPGSHGGAVWGTGDWAIVALELGDTAWAMDMANVIADNYTKILTEPDPCGFEYVGWGKALKAFQAVNPTAYAAEIADIVSILASRQQEDGSFTGWVQDEAYVTMGLFSVGEVEMANKSAVWLVENQGYDTIIGGWKLPDGNEYSEVTSEAGQAIFNVMQTIGTVDLDHYSDGIIDVKTMTISQAIEAAYPGDTIMVHDGVYYENIVINKPLTLTSASPAIIDGGAAGNCITVSANNIVVNGFEIRNGYNGIIGETDGSTFSNNIIHDNLNILGYAGVGILLWGDNDNNIITGNEIYSNDRQGIFIGYSDTSKLSTENVISHNIVYNNGLYRYANGPDASAYGVQLWCADNNVVEYNEIYGHDDWFPYGGTFDFAQGIYLCASFNNIVRGNNLHDNNYGVGVWAAGRTPVGSNQIKYNNIVGNNGFGLRTFDTVATDARFNWWGNSNGPTHSSNPIGTGDAISNYIDYSPWLGNAFEVMPRTYHVNPTGAPNAIQEAINEANSGDTIIVHEGTYYENLIVPKALSIQGVDKEATILQAQPVGYGDKAIEIKSSNVIISGFTISGYAPTETKPYYTYWGIYAYGSLTSHYTNIVVTDNIFTFLTQNGIQLGYVDGGLIANNVFKRETRLVWYDPPGPTPGSYIYVTTGGSGPALWYCTNVIIDPNIIQTDGVGIFLYSSSNILIESNIISAPDTTNPSDIGIHIQSCTNIDIIGNTIQNFTAGPKQYYTYGTTGAGINVYASKAINIRNNNLYNNTVGVLVQRLNLTTEPREVNIYYNNFEGNTEFDVLNCYNWIGKDKTYTPTNASFVVDARYNWWGHETGPYHGTSWMYMGEPYGPHYGLGDSVSDYVLYVPWLQVVHDVAVIDVSVSPTTVVAGETVIIHVTVENQGTDFENFRVTVYYDDTAIASQDVVNLFPGRSITITFYWDTTGMPRGTYAIKAVASTVPGETDMEDNTYTDGTVEILWHDVAIIDVTPDNTWVYQGHSINISVTVTNEGDFPETVTVTLYYNITANQIIGIQTINLNIGESQTLIFIWDTTGVEYCHNYTITAVAETTFDNDPSDNILADGKIKVRIIGDINGDGVVDMKDIYGVALAFGSYPGHRRWNPDADLNQDGKVDIKDIYATVLNYTKECR
jgi:parallel beta-helix repeat protein